MGMPTEADWRWAAKWISISRIDGRMEHLIRGDDSNVLLFPTRASARTFIKEKYGYIAGREDLRQEPHGWRLPQAVKVSVVIQGKNKTHHDP